MLLLLLHRSRYVLLPQLLLLLLLLLLQGKCPCTAAMKAGNALHMRTLVHACGGLLATSTLLKLHVDGFRLCPFTLQDA
jgi:hypothetical protein